VPSSPSSSYIAPQLLSASTMPKSTTSSRSTSMHAIAAPSSPGLEDLQRFPSESLHSFSFAHQSEDYLHSRQNILRKSIEFMRDRLGWAASSPALASAQARVSGDAELQSMMELLKRANILGVDTSKAENDIASYGPMTGPADVDGANIFEKSFSHRSPRIPEDAVLECETEGDDDNTHDLDLNEDGEEGSGILDLEPGTQRSGLKRTLTDISSLSLQAKLMEALARPYSTNSQNSSYSLWSPPALPGTAPAAQNAGGPSLHSHSSKWAPAAQAVFRTEAQSPWTILAANDLACLVFGVTRAEVRKIGILEVVQEDRRSWLEDKLRGPGPDSDEKARAAASHSMAKTTATKSLVGSRGGITAQLLSKAPARETTQRRAQTDDGSGGYYKPKAPKNHPATKSRGVLLCGDVVPIQKRNGSTGSASFWVMEKRGGLIWVLEEIIENVAHLKIDKEGVVSEARGDVEPIWGQERIKQGTSVYALFGKLLEISSGSTHDDPISTLSKLCHFTARTAYGINVPTTSSAMPGHGELRVSSYPHIAGVMVVSPSSLKITSSNAVFSAALFGQEHPEGSLITELLPDFDDLLRVLTEEDDVELVDGIVIPEHSFRRARALIALREGKADAASIFLRPSGLPARHRDGAELMVDVQMRVVRSESVFAVGKENTIEETDEEIEGEKMAVTEVVYALWITYSRQLHSAGLGISGLKSARTSRPITPPSQPSPGQTVVLASPEPQPLVASSRSADSSQISLLTQQLQEATSTTISDEPLEHPGPNVVNVSSEPYKKKTIDDFVILEEMGSGAYGQVKLGRYKKNNSRKMVLKYVTKRRILVDTWTRDRRLGTVPLEIHVMDYLRRDGFKHPNIVEMVDFFEDDINYYIEMQPHGIPGMDLFDYIELRTNMEEGECRSIFKQVVGAIHHLHTTALVVHRDIKDENVVLDGEGKIKLIDFGSAAYIKNGPFDVFVGTIGKLNCLDPC
jgi:protein-serine/threonine kinase